MSGQTERGVSSPVDQIIAETEHMREMKRTRAEWEASLVGQLTLTAGDIDPDHARWGRACSRGQDGKIAWNGEAIDGEELRLESETVYTVYSGELRVFLFRDPDYFYVALGRRSEEDPEKIQLTRTLVLNENEARILVETLSSHLPVKS